MHLYRRCTVSLVSAIQVQLVLDPALESPCITLSLPEMPFIDFQLHSQVGAKYILKVNHPCRCVDAGHCKHVDVTECFVQDLPHPKNMLHSFLMQTIQKELIAPQQIQLRLSGVSLLHKFRHFRRHRSGTCPCLPAETISYCLILSALLYAGANRSDDDDVAPQVERKTRIPSNAPSVPVAAAAPTSLPASSTARTSSTSTAQPAGSLPAATTRHSRHRSSHSQRRQNTRGGAQQD